MLDDHQTPLPAHGHFTTLEWGDGTGRNPRYRQDQQHGAVAAPIVSARKDGDGHSLSAFASPIVGVASAGVSHYVESGALLVSDVGPYYLEDPSIVLVRRHLEDALRREGVPIDDQAPKVIEVQVLRFEFINAMKKGDLTMAIGGNVLLRAIIAQPNTRQVDVSVLEAGEQNVGITATSADVGEFVGLTLSRAMERLLASSEIADALTGSAEHK